MVDESPSPEVRPGNTRFNHTVGQHVTLSFFPQGDRAAVESLVPLINGDFTGTTEDILRWAACKWGISQDIVFAQAAVESWWRQTTLGDWETSGCPPGHPPGHDGRPSGSLFSQISSPLKQDRQIAYVASAFMAVDDAMPGQAAWSKL